MATCSKDVDCREEERRGGLVLSDVTCPICLSIMVEPVTMPCDHQLCMPCFEQHVQKASLSCPLCRRRISVWCRRASRESRLVNRALWEAIQVVFPDRVKARMDGLDDPDEVCPTQAVHQMCEPGEIKLEFQAQLQQLHKELRQDQEAQDRASLTYISTLKSEITEIGIRINGDVSVPKCNGHGHACEGEGTLSSGDKAICPPPAESAAPEDPPRRSSASPDSLRGELTHFRPIQTAPLTPPKRLPNGRVEEPTLVRARPLLLNSRSPESPSLPLLAPVASISLSAVDNGPSPFVPATPKLNGVQLLSDVASTSMASTSAGSVTSAATVDAVPEPSVPTRKRQPRCRPKRTRAPSPVPKRVMEAPVLDEVFLEGQRLLEKRIRQEQEDWKLALRLQKEFNRERRGIDRRNGSENEYQLRQRRTQSNHRGERHERRKV